MTAMINIFIHIFLRNNIANLCQIKILLYDRSHMTKMTAMSIIRQNPTIIFFPGNQASMSLGFGINEGLKLFK